MAKKIPKNLSVPDASTVEEFVKHARKVWRKAHPEKSKQKGREPSRGEVFDGLNILMINERLEGKKLNLYQLMKAWKEQFPDQHFPSEDTVHTWAEIWLQMVKLKMILGEEKFMPFWKRVGSLYSFGQRSPLTT